MNFTYTAKEAFKAAQLHNKELEARELERYLASVNEAIVAATKRGVTEVPMPRHNSLKGKAIEAVTALGYSVIYPDNYSPVITWAHNA